MADTSYSLGAGSTSANAAASSACSEPSRPVLITKDSPYSEFAFFDENAMAEAEQARYGEAFESAVTVHQLPDVAYLRHAVIPLLVPALQAVARAKPKDPIQYLAAYLVSNNPQRSQVLPTPAADFPVLMGRVPLQQARPPTPQVPATPVAAEQPAPTTSASPNKKK